MDNTEKSRISDLDRLRAGLVDPESELASRIHVGLVESQSLTEQTELWDKLRMRLDELESTDTRLTNLLRIRRRSVLNGKGAHKAERFTLLQMALAVAASMVFTLSVVYWTGGFSGSSLTSVSLAKTSAPAIPGVNMERAKPGAFTDSDVASNVDFYAWIENQEALFVELAN